MMSLSEQQVLNMTVNVCAAVIFNINNVIKCKAIASWPLALAYSAAMLVDTERRMRKGILHKKRVNLHPD